MTESLVVSDAVLLSNKRPGARVGSSPDSAGRGHQWGECLTRTREWTIHGLHGPASAYTRRHLCESQRALPTRGNPHSKQIRL